MSRATLDKLRDIAPGRRDVPVPADRIRLFGLPVWVSEVVPEGEFWLVPTAQPNWINPRSGELLQPGCVYCGEQQCDCVIYGGDELKAYRERLKAARDADGRAKG